MRIVNPSRESLPEEEFFQLVFPSFELPNKFAPYPPGYFGGLTDARVQPPYWSASPMKYYIQEGVLYSRHSQAGEGEYFPHRKSPDEFVKEWFDDVKKDLGSRYKISDVTDEPLRPKF